MSTRDALLKAWARWDQRPGDPFAAALMERACETVADEIGVTTTALRHELARLCREGRSIEQALDTISAGGGLAAALSAGKGAPPVPHAGKGDPTVPAEPIIQPSACAYCLRDEHHLCRPDIHPCRCARNGHEIDAPRSDGSQHPPPVGNQDDRFVGPAPCSAEGRRTAEVA